MTESVRTEEGPVCGGPARGDAPGASAASPDVPPMEPASPRKAVLLLAFVAVCVTAIYLTPLRDALAPLRHMEMPPWIDDARAWVRERGWLGAAAFAGIAAVAVGVGMPRLAVAFVAGALFGWVEGTVLAQFGTFAGCWATFVIGRHLGRDWVQSLVTRKFPRARSLLDFIARHAFEANVLMRLTPVGNAFATNLLFAVSRTRLRTFLVATFVGTLPETAIAALIGSAAKGRDFAPRVLGGALALALLGFGVTWWTRRRRRGDARSAPRPT